MIIWFKTQTSHTIMRSINKPTNNKHIALFRAATSWNIPPSLPHYVLKDFPLFTFWDIFLAPSSPPSLCPHQGTSPALYLCTSCNLSLPHTISLSPHIMEHLSRSIYLPFLSLSRAMILSLGSASAGRERYSYSAPSVANKIYLSRKRRGVYVKWR